MALPPPLHDPAHIETRLLVVAQMLEHAVAEVHRAMADLRAVVGPVDESRPDGWPTITAEGRQP
jgi:hypothetical protein